jgi:phage terminase small subunit
MTEKVYTLSQQQARFIEAVMSGKNRTDAYIDAGYRVKDRNSARSAAARLYATDSVQREIQRRREMARHNSDYHLIRLSRSALEELDGMVRDCQNERVKLEAIKAILEYAGLGPKHPATHDGSSEVSFKDVVLGLGQRNEAIAEEYWYGGSEE